MNTKRVYGKDKPAPSELASYFGLTVEVIFRLRNRSLIRWSDRESIVDSEDLQQMTERCAA